MTTLTKKGFESFLNKIRKADETQVNAQFEIAGILSAIREHKLYETGEYNSFGAMVKKELTFSLYTADCYCRLHNRYMKFGYNQPEFLKLMQAFEWRVVEKCLRDADKKMGMRAMQNWVNAKNQEPNRQYNFHIEDDDEALRLETLLARFGLETSEAGTRTHMTTALLALLKDYERLDQNGTQLTLLGSPDEEETEAAKAKREAAAQARYVAKSSAAKAKRVSKKEAQAA